MLLKIIKNTLMAFALLISSCEQSVKRPQRKQINYPNGAIGLRWPLQDDTTKWRQILIDPRRKLISLQHGQNDSLAGWQYNYRYDSTADYGVGKLAFIWFAKGGVQDGRWYQFYPSGRIHIVAEKKNNKWSGKYFEFFDKKLYSPALYMEFALLGERSAQNGAIAFDSITKRPILQRSFGLPRVKAKQDSISLGDSLFFTVRLKIINSECHSASVQLASYPDSAAFTGTSRSVKCWVKPIKRGDNRVEGTFFCGGKEEIQRNNEVQVQGSLSYFSYPYYVR